MGKLKDVSNIHIEDILKLSDKNVGKRIEIPYNIIAQRDYNSIEIFINDESISDFAGQVDQLEDRYLGMVEAASSNLALSTTSLHSITFIDI